MFLKVSSHLILKTKSFMKYLKKTLEIFQSEIFRRASLLVILSGYLTLNNFVTSRQCQSCISCIGTLIYRLMLFPMIPISIFCDQEFDKRRMTFLHVKYGRQLYIVGLCELTRWLAAWHKALLLYLFKHFTVHIIHNGRKTAIANECELIARSGTCHLRVKTG